MSNNIDFHQKYFESLRILQPSILNLSSQHMLQLSSYKPNLHTSSWQKLLKAVKIRKMYHLSNKRWFQWQNEPREEQQLFDTIIASFVIHKMQRLERHICELICYSFLNGLFKSVWCLSKNSIIGAIYHFIHNRASYILHTR